MLSKMTMSELLSTIKSGDTVLIKRNDHELSIRIHGRNENDGEYVKSGIVMDLASFMQPDDRGYLAERLFTQWMQKTGKRHESRAEENHSADGGRARRIC